VDARGVGDHAIEVEQDGVVPVPGDGTLGIGLWHFSLSCCQCLFIAGQLP